MRGSGKLKRIAIIGLFLSFFSFVIVGFGATTGNIASFMPIIPWASFAIFMVILAFSSSNNENGTESDRGYRGRTTHQTKIKCPSCRTLNEENAKYCNQCGEYL